MAFRHILAQLEAQRARLRPEDDDLAASIVAKTRVGLQDHSYLDAESFRRLLIYWRATREKIDGVGTDALKPYTTDDFSHHASIFCGHTKVERDDMNAIFSTEYLFKMRMTRRHAIRPPQARLPPLVTN